MLGQMTTQEFRDLKLGDRVDVGHGSIWAVQSIEKEEPRWLLGKIEHTTNITLITEEDCATLTKVS